MDIVRPAISSVAGYVPGEQPQTDGWIKLNTNENPYPASPRVAEAVDAALKRGLQIYPDPHATPFRQAAAELFDVEPDWILPANGSDENLTIIMRTFVDPHDTITYPYPGYVLYNTLGMIQDCKVLPMVLADFAEFSEENLQLASQCKLVLAPNPNSPTGAFWTDDQVRQVVPDRGLLILDGAYADFADAPQSAAFLAGDLEKRVIMTRTMSKSYSLAGLRFGFAIAHPDLIREMGKVKDSYNCDALSIAAATAALQDQEWMRNNRQKILATRDRVQPELSELGFDIATSQANFLWMTHDSGEHNRIFEELKERRILIRYMKFPLVESSVGTMDGLRITIGTGGQMDKLLAALKEIV